MRLGVKAIQLTWWVDEWPEPVWMGRVVVSAGRPMLGPVLGVVAAHVAWALRSPYWEVSVSISPGTGELALDLIVTGAGPGYAPSHA